LALSGATLAAAAAVPTKSKIIPNETIKSKIKNDIKIDPTLLIM